MRVSAQQKDNIALFCVWPEVEQSNLATLHINYSMFDVDKLMRLRATKLVQYFTEHLQCCWCRNLLISTLKTRASILPSR